MADPVRKVDENASGRFYVDDTCIDCELCREIAPAHFIRQDDRKYSYVFNQPIMVIEVDACLDALEQCPVEAIGELGEG